MKKKKKEEEGKNVQSVVTSFWDISFTITKIRRGNIYYLIILFLLSFHLFIIIFIPIFTLNEESLTSF